MLDTTISHQRAKRLAYEGDALVDCYAVAVKLLGLVLVVPPNCYSALQKINANFNVVDDSWQINLAKLKSAHS